MASGPSGRANCPPRSGATTTRSAVTGCSASAASWVPRPTRRTPEGLPTRARRRIVPIAFARGAMGDWGGPPAEEAMRYALFALAFSIPVASAPSSGAEEASDLAGIYEIQGETTVQGSPDRFAITGKLVLRGTG